MNVAPFPNGELHLKSLDYYQGYAHHTQLILQMSLSFDSFFCRQQSWEVSCSKCFAGSASKAGGAQVASGCTIRLRPTASDSNNFCVGYQGDGSLRATSAACTGAQTFDLWTAVPPAPSKGSGTCNPTLTGLGVSIIGGSTEWGVAQDVAGTALSHSLGKAPLNSSAEWRVMQIGSSNPTYVFGYVFRFASFNSEFLFNRHRDIKQTSLVVEALSGAEGAAPTLTLSPMDSSHECVEFNVHQNLLTRLYRTQIWQIDCQQCFSNAASNPGGGQLAAGCAIKSVASNLCAEVMSGVSAPIGATSCSGSVLQTFDIWLPTFSTGMGRPPSSSSPSHSASSSRPSSSSTSSNSRTCAPDVGGLGVSIIAGSKEWGVSSAVAGTALRSDLGKSPLSSTAEWRVQQLGSAQGPTPPTYIFGYVSASVFRARILIIHSREIGHTGLVVDALSGAGGGNPVLTLSPMDTSSECVGFSYAPEIF